MLEVFNPVNAAENIGAFLVAGGDVLLVIMVATFIMWLLIVERFVYFVMANRTVKRRAYAAWEDRTDHNSWYAHAIRDKLISEVKESVSANLNIIKVFVAVAPLLGLLGTVTGMVEVFDVMAVTGSSNARLMAGGISKATIPTMAGLVASLSGIVAMNILERQANRSISEVSDRLLIE
ncbi:MotA/TolQ/ExbB proton channel family protein [Parvularcula dongshanensis]|uniref:Biopolymer transport protein ExbB n=1 Tax=Parvularcula dongshanensis TaxID=1173995 RepID=A0A840I4W5_9PROT|nr:MotA/TolQ/ExbB proton channel family protein [Parvularcula dongshanensis]MBB4659218.1 biopolymer transport protein ExbB [Parvularcula dongshanensis]